MPVHPLHLPREHFFSGRGTSPCFGAKEGPRGGPPTRRHKERGPLSCGGSTSPKRHRPGGNIPVVTRDRLGPSGSGAGPEARTPCLVQSQAHRRRTAGGEVEETEATHCPPLTPPNKPLGPSLSSTFLPFPPLL
uniref:Uncharacterized protein n=1 Tax=Pipistrellus kuhlii TaxID=59472 RepID=A0A7J7S426_PIPKU|nr:hypothetical protein mPipKuh1_010188 [Pipistrellus kuhlii]